MENGHRFEALDHTVYSGKRTRVPVYVDAREGLTEDSQVLLHAADIIGGNINLFKDGIRELEKRINVMTSDTSHNPDPERGIIISDQDSTSSVSIGSLYTRVTVNDIGVWEVETPLVTDMIREWTKMEEDSSRG